MNSLMNAGDYEHNSTRFVHSNVTECPRMLSNLDLRFNLDFSSQEEIKLTRWQKVEIPTEYYGSVIGRHEANLLEISKETGAEVTRIRGKVHIIQGTKQQRDHVELLIKRRVVGSLDKCLFPLSQ